MSQNAALEAVARGRIARTEKVIQETVDCVRFGIPRAAETDLDRREASIQRNLRVPGFMATQMTNQMETESLAAPGAEALRGATIDFVPVSYMERGLQAARAVARVAFPTGGPKAPVS